MDEPQQHNGSEADIDPADAGPAGPLEGVKPTMSKNLLYGGLHVHAQTVAIVLAEAAGEIRNYGAVSSGLETLEKTMSRIRKAHPGCELRVC
jgi:hypothetical protein